jgi:molybdopterin molybdotransferase
MSEQIISEQIEKTVEEVQAQVLSTIRAIDGEQELALGEALGRVLARDIISPINVPAHNNSAMDGFAIQADDYERGIRRFRIIGKALAGKPSGLNPAAGEAVRVTTGAVMPGRCDMVIVQEISQILEGDLIIPDGQERGQNRRLAGEDLKLGQSALKLGRILTASDLGLIASLGIANIAVKPRLKVAFFSTGDEIRSLGEPLSEGQIYDSNRFTLRGMLTRLGCDLIDMGVVKDSPADLEVAMRQAAAQADVIISSGGVSVGEADYTKTVMAKLGDVEFWRIAMRPGRPMAFGTLLGKPYFGLPGNPVAVMVTFYFFARQPLLKLAGAIAPELALFKVRLKTPIRKRPGRVEYQRACLVVGPSGELEAHLTGQQGSGVLSSMSEANCFIVMGHAEGSAGVEDFVSCLPFNGLI